MVRLDGINLPDNVKSVTLNGGWIVAITKEGSLVSIRALGNTNWYDAKHQAVMTALCGLEKAMSALLGEVIK